MKRVAVLAYYFPPIGGAGAQRTTKFVRYLPEYDYQPVVITGTGQRRAYLTPLDDTLSEEVCDREVVRISNPERPVSVGVRRRAERWMRVPSPFATWYRAETSAAARAVTQLDLVYASMPPWEAAEVAVELGRDMNVPIVLDLRDPWALDEMSIYPTAVHRRVEARRMRKLLCSADAVVMNTAEARSRVLAAFPQLRNKLVVSIPNGFDGADFGGRIVPRTDDAFRIVHTGYFQTDRGLEQRRKALVRRVLGGAKGRVDMLTRSHIHLIAAIRRSINERPELAGTIEVHLAGVLTRLERELAKLPFVHPLGYVPHAAAIELMRGADLLFLPMHDLPPGSRATTVPGKTYEYLAAGRPLLAAVPEGDARDLLVAAGNAHVCDPADVAALQAGLMAELVRWQHRTAARQPRPDVVRQFERRRLTADLAAVFDAVVRVRT